MTVNSLQARQVSDLCVGKPAARPLSLSATVGDALLALRSGGSDDRLVIWTADGPAPERKACAWNVCMVDVLCYLCAEQNLDAPMAALGAPASALLPASLVRQVEPSSRYASTLITPSRSLCRRDFSDFVASFGDPQHFGSTRRDS